MGTPLSRGICQDTEYLVLLLAASISVSAPPSSAWSRDSFGTSGLPLNNNIYFNAEKRIITEIEKEKNKIQRR